MAFLNLKSLASFSLIFVSIFLNAQEFQGKAIYMSKTTVDMENFGRPNMTEEQKKRMAARLKNMFQKTFVLVFNRKESEYKLEEKLEAPTQGSGGGRFGAIMSGAVDGVKYKNIQTKVALQELELFGKLFLVKEPLPEYKWSITGETKQIGGYTCYKATALKTWKDFDMTALRRPPNAENNNETEQKTEEQNTSTETEVTAWYTMQIPINQGPADYWGLPGLILEINTNQTTILCSKIVLNPEDQKAIKQPTKGKEITKEAYVEIATKKFQEMRENFRRRGQGGRNDRR